MATVNCAVEGNVYYLGGSSTLYATAQSVCTQNSPGGPYVGQNKSGSTYSIYRGVLRFDTTALSGVTVTGVVAKLACNVDASTTDFDLEIVKCDWSAYYPITVGNRQDAFVLADSSSVDNTWRNTSGMSPNTYYDSGALDPSYINTSGGYTYYALVSGRDRGDTAPSGAEYIAIDTRPTYKYAYLEVTYTEGGGGSSTPIHLIRTGMQPGMRIGL